MAGVCRKAWRIATAAPRRSACINRHRGRHRYRNRGKPCDSAGSTCASTAPPVSEGRGNRYRFRSRPRPRPREGAPRLLASACSPLPVSDRSPIATWGLQGHAVQFNGAFPPPGRERSCSSLTCGRMAGKPFSVGRRIGDKEVARHPRRNHRDTHEIVSVRTAVHLWWRLGHMDRELHTWVDQFVVLHGGKS